MRGPPVLIFAQHMHAGGRAVDKTAQLIVVHLRAAGFLQGYTDSFSHIQHGDGLHEQISAFVSVMS